MERGREGEDWTSLTIIKYFGRTLWRLRDFINRFMDLGRFLVQTTKEILASFFIIRCSINYDDEFKSGRE